jgi:hypothetical protein
VADEQRQRRRITLDLPSDLIEKLDSLKAEWSLRSRGGVVLRLLESIFSADESPELEEAIALEPLDDLPSFDEQGALVLIAGHGLVQSVAEGEPPKDLAADLAADLSTDSLRSVNSSAVGGIDLPGFVRRQTVQLKHSLKRQDTQTPAPLDMLPPVSPELVERCLQIVRDHWMQLYSTAPNETVLEAAMIWLAKDIWPQADHSDGRQFTWSLAVDNLRGFAPAWLDGPANFERVIVVAGLLEDPFSANTLDLRLPSLIHRFVHRFRQRPRGTSFEALEHTMTLHGALKLLQLPTAAGQRLTLNQIRDAYRQLALSAHPDSGGSTEAMRRLNEAYQLLKQLYRTAP